MTWSESSRKAAQEARARAALQRERERQERLRQTHQGLVTGVLPRPVAQPAPPPPPPKPVYKVRPLTNPKPDPAGYIPPIDYPFIRDSVEQGKHVMLVGPTGCGKTSLCESLARDLGRPLRRQNFHGEATVDNVMGFREIKNDNGVPVTKTTYGQLALAMMEGALYLTDEVDSGHPRVLFCLHRPMEWKKGVRPTLEFDGETIVAKEGFCILAGCNTLGTGDDSGLYQGTNVLNRAFLNRFVGGTFFLDYSPQETAIVEAAGCDQRTASRIVTFAIAVRRAAKAQNLPIVITTRDLMELGMEAKNWGLGHAFRLKVMSKLSEEEKQLVSSQTDYKWISTEGV